MLTSVCLGSLFRYYDISYMQCACVDWCSGVWAIKRNLVVYLYIFFIVRFAVWCFFLSDVLRSMLVKDSNEAFLASLKIICS